MMSIFRLLWQLVHDPSFRKFLSAKKTGGEVGTIGRDHQDGRRSTMIESQWCLSSCMISQTLCGPTDRFWPHFAQRLRHPNALQEEIRRIRQLHSIGEDYNHRCSDIYHPDLHGPILLYHRRLGRTAIGTAETSAPDLFLGSAAPGQYSLDLAGAV